MKIFVFGLTVNKMGSQCGKIFTALGNLKRHILSVHGQKSWRCEICGHTDQNTNVCDINVKRNKQTIMIL